MPPDAGLPANDPLPGKEGERRVPEPVCFCCVNPSSWDSALETARAPGGGGSDLPRAGAASQMAMLATARDLKNCRRASRQAPAPVGPLKESPAKLGGSTVHKPPCSAAWHPHASSQYVSRILCSGML